MNQDVDHFNQSHHHGEDAQLTSIGDNTNLTNW